MSNRGRIRVCTGGTGLSGRHSFLFSTKHHIPIGDAIKNKVRVRLAVLKPRGAGRRNQNTWGGVL